jgi:hypothetical protein
MSSSAKRPTPAAESAGAPTVVRLTLGVILAILVAMVACSQLGSESGEASGPAPADVLPAGFAIPAGAQVVSQGEAEPGSGVITLQVPATADDLVTFYRQHLPKSGWITEPWEGTNPYGQATQGLVLNNDGKEGALSVTDGEDGTATVQINLNQPISPTAPSASMSGGS